MTQLIKRREKSKKEALVLSIEILTKRFQMGDFNGTNLAEAEAEQAKMPSTFIAPFLYSSNNNIYNGVSNSTNYRER